MKLLSPLWLSIYAVMILNHIKNRLEQDALKFSAWFHENCTILTDDKFNLLLFSNKANGDSVTAGNLLMKESTVEKLLGVTLDKNLDFRTQLDSLCQSDSQKFQVLRGISKFLNTDENSSL